MNNFKKKIQKTIPNFSAFTVFVIFMTFSSVVFGLTIKENQIRNIPPLSETSLNVLDSLPFAKIILYRPENQLSRKYNLTTNIDGTFGIKNKEVIRLDAHSNKFVISVDAVGHKNDSFTFILSQNKTHYFRIQDRNNYSGFRAFIEVIEVTEDTFNRDNF